MNKQSYLRIRKEIDFAPRPSALVEYFVVDLFLLVSIASLAHWLHPAAGAPLFAALMFRNFGLMHDAVHGALSKRRRLNFALGVWSGGLCLLPFEAWRRSHLQHHLWSGNIERDPVMALRIILPNLPAGPQAMLTFFWRSWFPLLGFLQYALFWKLAVSESFVRPSAKLFASIALPLVFWSTSLSVLPSSVVVFTVVPGIFLYLLLVEVVNFPHHLQLPSLTADERLSPWEQESTARSCIYPRWFARYVVLNFNYHTEHHLFPDAPWQRLEALHAVVQKELGLTQNLDLNMEWTWKNRRSPIRELARTPLRLDSSGADIKKTA